MYGSYGISIGFTQNNRMDNYVVGVIVHDVHIVHNVHGNFKIYSEKGQE